jgi:hypothetical protein
MMTETGKQHAAELERTQLINQEIGIHNENISAELNRHRDALRHIENVYRLRLGAQ